MKKKNTLIHCAFLAEAKPIIGLFKLQKISSVFYENEDIVLVIGGMGCEKTQNALQLVFVSYEFKKAINIGIAGCKNTDIAIGSLFCTNHKLQEIPVATLQSFENPVTCKDDIQSTLVDMEADIFLKICQKHLEKENVFVFKVVSDYLEDTIPTKAFVNELIQKNLKKVIKYV